MKTRDGKIREVKIKSNGKQQKVFILIALEPALIDMYQRLADIKGVTRSTFIRCDLKDHRRLKTDGVDWSETNEKKTYI